MLSVLRFSKLSSDQWPIDRSWLRARRTIPLAVQERFFKAWRAYLDAVVVHAERRGNSYICTLDEYLAARREDAGPKPFFAFTEVCLKLELPHEVMKHPAIVSLEQDAADMISIINVRRVYFTRHSHNFQLCFHTLHV